MKIVTFILLAILILEPISTTSLSIQTERTALALYNSQQNNQRGKEKTIIFAGNFIIGVLCYWFGPLEAVRYALEDTFDDKSDEECYYKTIQSEYRELKESIKKQQEEKREAIFEEKETKELELFKEEEEKCSKQKKAEYKALVEKRKELVKNYRANKKKLKEYLKKKEKGKLILTDTEFNDLQISVKILKQRAEDYKELASVAKPRGCIKQALSKGLVKFKNVVQKKLVIIKDFLVRHLKSALFIAKRAMKCLAKHAGDILEEFVVLFVYDLGGKIAEIVAKAINPIVGVVISELINVFWLCVDIYYLIKAIHKKSTKDIGFYLGSMTGKIIGSLLGGKKKLRKLRKIK